jgi:heme ABC exporter ATP-binding subunit CcmA
LIIAENITFRFGSRVIIRKFNGSFAPGSLTVISAPNGTGKSTLLSLLTGLRTLQDGDIRLQLNNIDYEQESREFKNYIQYLSSEHNGLFYHFDAFTNIKFWCELSGQTTNTSEIQEHLETWGLANQVINHSLPVQRFSTGMKRRLALARLNIVNSTLWILDEPFQGLDQSGISQLATCIQHHCNNSGSAIIVSHDLEPFKNIEHGLITENNLMSEDR